MESSRTQNSLRNMMFGIISRIVSIVFPFIVRTIFIKTIGEEYLGLNTLFSSILQVLNLADLGFATAIVASMYKPIAEHDAQTVSALLRLFRNIYRVIGLSILIVGLLITPFIRSFINGEPPQGINIYILWILYLINTVISYLLFAYKVSLLNAHQRNDITSKIGTISAIGIGIIQIYVVSILKSVYLYVALTIICSCIYNIWCAIECNKKYPQYNCSGKIESKIKNKIIKDVGALTIQKIGNVVSVSLDSIVISAFLGLATVAIYGNYYYVISAISTFVVLIYSSITASVGNSIALESIHKNYNDFKKFVFLNTWFIGWCCICFMCLFQDFMLIWMGEKLLFEISIVLCLVLRFFFEQLRKIVLTYKDAAGIWWYDKWRPLAGCTVNLILNIVLVKVIGVSGVALSTVISYALVEMPWETHVLFKHYFKRSEMEYYKEVLISIVAIVVSGIMTYALCEILPVNGVAALVIKTLICCIFYNVVFCLLNFKNKFFLNSKELIMKLYKAILKRERLD